MLPEDIYFNTLPSYQDFFPSSEGGDLLPQQPRQFDQPFEFEPAETFTQHSHFLELNTTSGQMMTLPFQNSELFSAYEQQEMNWHTTPVLPPYSPSMAQQQTSYKLDDKSDLFTSDWNSYSSDEFMMVSPSTVDWSSYNSNSLLTESASSPDWDSYHSDDFMIESPSSNVQTIATITNFPHAANDYLNTDTAPPQPTVTQAPLVLPQLARNLPSIESLFLNNTQLKSFVAKSLCGILRQIAAAHFSNRAGLDKTVKDETQILWQSIIQPSTERSPKSYTFNTSNVESTEALKGFVHALIPALRAYYQSNYKHWYEFNANGRAYWLSSSGTQVTVRYEKPGADNPVPLLQIAKP